MLISSPRSPDQNFEKAILFSIVENFNNYIFEDDLFSHSPGGRAASYELYQLFTYSISNWYACRRFQGVFFWWWGGGVREDWFTWEDLSMEEFSMGVVNFYEGGAGYSSIT